MVGQNVALGERLIDGGRGRGRALRGEGLEEG